MTDFRALCAELVEKLDELNCHYNVPSQSAMIERACAALADESASVIGEPSFDELRNLWANAPCIDEAPGGVAFARAVLARWGNPAPQPVPVSERLPGQEDCDEKGYCWRWNTISGVWSRQHYSRHWYEFETHWLPAHALPLPGQEVR